MKKIKIIISLLFLSLLVSLVFANHESFNVAVECLPTSVSGAGESVVCEVITTSQLGEDDTTTIATEQGVAGMEFEVVTTHILVSVQALGGSVFNSPISDGYSVAAATGTPTTLGTDGSRNVLATLNLNSGAASGEVNLRNFVVRIKTGVLSQDANSPNAITPATISVITCTSQCTSAATQCSSSGQIQTCANYNSDSCTEWGGDADCPTGQVCSAGNCVVPPPTCGDASCNGEETGANCPSDCSVCQNVACSANQVCEENICKLLENQACVLLNNDCASYLDCIRVRDDTAGNSQYKCKNLDGLKDVNDGVLSSIKSVIKSDIPLYQRLVSISGTFRDILRTDDTSIACTIGGNECSTSGESLECVLKGNGQGRCVYLDGVEVASDLSSSDGALGRIKSILKNDSPYQAMSFLQRLALIAKELNELFS